MRSHRKIEQLQVSRSPALTISDESHKIQKPPSPPSGKKKPVIIYVVSPEVIHVEASEFMSLVQRLTGPNSKNITSRSGRDKADQQHQPSTSGGHRDDGVHRRQLPVRVKARVLKSSGGGPARGILASNQDHASSQATASLSPRLYFHDLSPPSFGVRKDGSMTSPSWLFHGDEFLDQSSDRFQTPFLDIFSQVPDH